MQAWTIIALFSVGCFVSFLIGCGYGSDRTREIFREYLSEDEFLGIMKDMKE